MCGRTDVLAPEFPPSILDADYCNMLYFQDAAGKCQVPKSAHSAFYMVQLTGISLKYSFNKSHCNCLLLLRKLGKRPAWKATFSPSPGCCDSVLTRSPRKAVASLCWWSWCWCGVDESSLWFRGAPIPEGWPGLESDHHQELADVWNPGQDTVEDALSQQEIGPETD